MKIKMADKKFDQIRKIWYLWLRPKSNTSLLYSMRKTVREQSSMSEIIEFEKQ